MREHADALPVAIDVEGAEVRGTDFGGMVSGQLRFAAGTDLAPVLAGLPNDHCQCPHWGYVIEGEIVVTYEDGTEETVKAGDLYYWPPGHTVRFPADTRYVEFSPSAEMMNVLAHVKNQMGIG